MKKIIVFSMVLLATVQASGQQKPHYTQYVLNQYILNPALSGIENYVDIKASHRHQWVGIADAPITSYFTVQAPLGKTDTRVSSTGYAPKGENPRGRDYWSEYTAAQPHHGIGLQVMHDVTGPLSRTSIMGTYAYHMGLSPRTSLAAGFGAGASRMSLNASKLNFNQPNDPSVYQNGLIDQWKPDVSAGLYLYSADYFLGVSAQQVVPQRIQFRENTLRKEDGKLVPHLFLTGGYRFLLGEDFNVTPSVLVKYINPVPVQVDLNAKFQYRDAAWLGAGFRINDGFSGMAGLNISSTFNVSYSYDYTTSELNAYTRGTHEILIGFTINNKFGDSCPRNVW